MARSCREIARLCPLVPSPGWHVGADLPRCAFRRRDNLHYDGTIEPCAEGGRLRLAVNVDGVPRFALRLRSRLLGLARIRRDADVQ
jgi:hypothetical protein